MEDIIAAWGKIYITLSAQQIHELKEATCIIEAVLKEVCKKND